MMHLRVMVVLCAICLGSWAEAAEMKGFDLGFVRPGMVLSEFRTAFDNNDIKVLCSGENDHVASTDTATITVKDAWRQAGIGLCRHFKKSKDNSQTWGAVLVKIGDICCADLYVTTVTTDTGAQVAQINARAELDEFITLVTTFTLEYGIASKFDERHAMWTRNGQTAIIFHNDKATFLVIYDNALRLEFDARVSSSK